MKIFTIIGARPQFIKASVVSRVISQTKGMSEFLLHTGQHFDSNMSEIFFKELEIPKPDVQLNINGGSHGDMTGRMLMEIEKRLIEYKPDRVLVYGDTNSTLAGALAAAKLNIPVAHVEAGLRSFNKVMPEEINRILTDQVSDILFCPTFTAMQNLRDEGFDRKPVRCLQVGDVMQDSALLFAQHAKFPAGVNIDGGYILATLHRAENTDDPNRLFEIVESVNTLHKTLAPVIMPLHPRTRQSIAHLGLKLKCHTIDPVGYFEMIGLLKNSKLVLTDSGGVQKEAFFFRKPCVTMRDQTEWVELIESGVNILAGADKNRILDAANRFFGMEVTDPHRLYGGGDAAMNIVQHLSN